MSNSLDQESEELRRAKLRIGSTLKGKYKIDRVLGIGGMAVVYAATHRNQAEFAVKMLHPEVSTNKDVSTRFLREGYAANSVKHPGVVLVVDDDVAEDGAAFLVMELLRGEGVEALWERKGMRLSPRIAAAIVDQLLDVLAAAHEKGIVHRDIKPANLFLTSDGTVKVLDFGIARARDALSGGTANVTGSGMLLGTPAFMSPEQAVAQTSDIDERTDLWAAGATLFSLISGQFVHTGDNAPRLLVNAATKPARSLSSVAQAPAEIVEVVAQALAFERGARFPNAKTMQAALRAACKRAFGAELTRESLVIETRSTGADAMAATDLASAPTLEMRQAYPQPSASAPPHFTPAAPVGATTAQPVSNESASVVRKKNGLLVPVLLGFSFACVVGGVAIAASVWRVHQKASAMPVDIASPSIASPSIASPSVAATASTTVALVAAPTLASPSSSASVATPTLAASVAATSASTSPDATHAAHPHAHVAPPSSVSQTAVAAPIPSAKTSCEPPYYFDAQGRKIFKADCL